MQYFFLFFPLYCRTLWCKWQPRIDNVGRKVSSDFVHVCIVLSWPCPTSHLPFFLLAVCVMIHYSTLDIIYSYIGDSAGYLDMGTSWYFSWKLNYFGIPKWKQGLFNIPQSGHESVYLLEPSFHSRTPNNSTFMKNISWCPCLKVRVNFYPRRNYAAHFTVKYWSYIRQTTITQRTLLCT